MPSASLLSQHTSFMLDQLKEFFFSSDGSLQFITVKFWATFIVFFNIYLLIRRQRRSLMMLYVLAFNLFFAFKANANPVMMLLLPTTGLVSWFLCRAIYLTVSQSKRRCLLALTILVTLLPLLYFKYTNFFLGTANDLFESNFALLKLIPPLGVSFYTFQALSYTMEVYRGNMRGWVSPLEYLFFLSFFPMLAAGPITRPNHFIPQLRRPVSAGRVCVYTGLWLIMVGLVKKAILSDYIAQFNGWIFEGPSEFSGFENMMGILGYTLQIYLDFSGYSDMAIGLAALLGFHLRDNFRFPYQSLNLTDFWRRWHISLSTWFRDYLYFPLGGSRCSKLRSYFNLFVTMLVSGLWHGASWMFVIWGSMHGAGLVINKMWKTVTARFAVSEKVGARWLSRFLSWLLTFAFVAAAWVFFASPSVETAVTVLTRSVQDFSWDYLVPFFNARPTWCVFLLLGYGFHFISERRSHRVQAWFIRAPWLVKFLLFVIIVQLVINFSQESVRPFIYAQF